MWNPWKAASQDHDLLVIFDELPPGLGGGAYIPDADGGAIFLDKSLSQRERKCVLAHELVHRERGGGCPLAGMPSGWRPVNWREEVRVHDEAVRRLVPPDELRAWCVGKADFLAVEPWEVAEHWHVTEEYAERALFLLTVEQQGGIR